MKTDYEYKRAMQVGTKGKGRKLLLHACCAPCSTACLERLIVDFDVTVYFYNPNMDSLEEYEKRAGEERLFIERAYENSVGLIVEEYDCENFSNVAEGFEDEPEGGARCARCFELRLRATANYAKVHGYDCFTTTLSVSPYKNASLINLIGERLAAEYGLEWTYADFKKSNGYLRSIELSKKYGLYRQNYCGCIFSKKQSESKK